MAKARRIIAVADSETDPFQIGRLPKPFIWGWFNGDDYREFETVHDFVDFTSRTRQICYAHNGGRFDWHFILDYVDEMTEVSVINGRLSKFKIGHCEFRDSWNIIPVPLSAYQKTEIDYSIMEASERHKPHNNAEIRKYLYDDCRFLFHLVSEFISEFGQGLTVAGTAMKQWRKISGRKVPKDDGSLFAELRPFYYGGRCQVFRSGEITKPFKLADINSAYPYAMLSDHPIGLNYYRLNGEEVETLASDELAQSFVEVECISRGALPMRMPNGSLGFPDDGERRVYKVTGHEYIAGLETGTISQCTLHCAYVFDEFCNFEEYVTHFYEQRNKAKANNDAARTLLYKLVMNALYGKFASNPDKYREYTVMNPEWLDETGCIQDEEDRTWEYSGDFGRYCLVAAELTEDMKRYYNLATAASITGYVRAYLWRAICKAGGVIYCDTDSIAATELDGLQFGTRLGEWTLEGAYSYGAVAGKKLYAFLGHDGVWKTASKGVRLSPDEIMEVARGADVSYTSASPVYSVHRGPHFLTRNIRATGT